MKLTIKYIFVTLCCISFIGCKRENNTLKEKIHITLNSTIDDKFQFSDVNYSEFPVISYENKYPTLYDKELQKFHGIPKLDSFLIVSKPMQYGPQKFKLYKNGYLTKDEFDNYYKFFPIDTVELSKKELKYTLHAVSGFTNGNQVVIVDSNNNYDFSDEEVYTFGNDFSFSHNNNPEAIDSLPIITIHHQVFFNDVYEEIEREIQLYPYSNNSHIYLLLDGTLDSISNKYTLMLKLKNYKKGVLKIDNSKYTIALQGLDKNVQEIVIKPDSINYEKSNLSFQWNFVYHKNDTVQLNKRIFKIDSIASNISEMILTEINNDSIKLYGYRIGNKTENYNLIGLNNQVFHISDSIKTDKPYTILDFWGTWCVPCKELTPDLKRFHKDNVDSINMFSIALDENTEVVKDYVNSNQLTWSQAFVDINDRTGSIIDKLEITEYPTLILLDDKNRIAYRGSGNTALKEIEKLIKKRESFDK